MEDEKIILHYSPNLSMGGTARMAADTAVAMQMGRWSRNVLLSPNGAAAGIPASYGIPCKRSRHLNVLRYPGEAQRLRRTASSIHATTILLYGLSAARVAWLAYRHVPQPERPRLVAILTGPVRGPFVPQTLALCDRVVAISRHLRNTLHTPSLTPLLDKEKLWVVPYGVDEGLVHPHFTPSDPWKEDWERRYPGFHRTMSLCIPGAITPVRGLELLPELTKALQEQQLKVHFYIAGDVRRADSAYLHKLQALYRREHLENHVTWVAPKDGMRELMSLCDFTLSTATLPATYDRAVLEALSLGARVAGFDHGVVGELLNTFLPEGRIPAGEINTMAEVLKQWSIYRPETVAGVPYPYRITDTAHSLAKLAK